MRERAAWMRPQPVLCLFSALAVAHGAGAADYQVDLETDGLVTGCTSAPADCTLRGAIENSNLTPGVVDSITFAGVAVVTLTLAGDEDLNQTGDLDVLDPVVIDGAEGVTIDASSVDDRVLHVLTAASPDVSVLRGLTITGGSSSSDGAVRCLNSALMIEDSLIVGNLRGGISVAAGCALDVVGTTIRGNTAPVGGGIAFLSTSSMMIAASAIVENHADIRGGGLVSGSASNAVIAIDNTTFSGNTTDGQGSAVAAFAPVSLESVTIVSDINAGPAIWHFDAEAVTTLKNGLVVGSCQDSVGGAFVSQGGNLESPGDTCDLIPGMDQIGVVDPKLEPLRSGAGLAPYHRPAADSPAVDDPLGVIARCTIFDQRLYDRPEDGNGDGTAECDTGAVERRPPEIFADGFEAGDTSAWSNTVP